MVFLWMENQWSRTPQWHLHVKYFCQVWCLLQLNAAILKSGPRAPQPWSFSSWLYQDQGCLVNHKLGNTCSLRLLPLYLHLIWYLSSPDWLDTADRDNELSAGQGWKCGMWKWKSLTCEPSWSLNWCPHPAVSQPAVPLPVFVSVVQDYSSKFTTEAKSTSYSTLMLILWGQKANLSL